jgi:hypothetical protein
MHFSVLILAYSVRNKGRLVRLVFRIIPSLHGIGVMKFSMKIRYRGSVYDMSFNVLSIKINYRPSFKHRDKHEKLVH